MVEVRVARVEGSDDRVALPSYESAGAAGADLRANLTVADRVVGLRIEPMGRVAVPTGLILALPEGYEGQVRPRSGLALRCGVTVANAPGTIDADYRGELLVLLVNLGAEPFEVRHGDRIAQLVIAPVSRADFALGPVGATVRGAGGLGSTGM
ncbi:MAG: dUTP diphosphatase [Shimia sp.]